MFAKKLSFAVFVLCCSLCATQPRAYDFNVDFENCTGREVNDFHVGMKGEVVVDHYYTGAQNPFGAGTATHFDSGGFTPPNDWTLVEFRGAVIPPQQRIHIGFTTGAKVRAQKDKKLVGNYAARWSINGVQIGQAPVPLAGCWYAYDQDNDRIAVYVDNDAGPDQITISNLSFHVSSSQIPLNNLVWESIPWSSMPGTVALSEDEVAGPFYINNVDDDDYVVFGWHTVWTGDPCVCRAIFQEKASISIPTLTEWGLIIFGVVLLGFITWVFLRRRKAISLGV